MAATRAAAGCSPTPPPISASRSGLVNLLSPDRIVVGGELGAATDLLREPMHRGLADTAMPAPAEAVRDPGELGERAVALGGIVTALRALAPA